MPRGAASPAVMERPPLTAVGPLGWLRQNPLNSWLNASLTLVLAVVLYGLGRGIIPWIFGEANWRVVSSNLGLLSWGRYPVEQAWRLGLALGVIVVLSVISWRARRPPAGGPRGPPCPRGWGGAAP